MDALSEEGPKSGDPETEFNDVLASAGPDRAEQIAAAADGPYFRTFNYGEREISADHPHHEAYLELRFLRRLIETVRRELNQGALRALNGLTNVHTIQATVHEIIDEVTGRQALRVTAHPHLKQIEDPATIHDGLDGLEGWVEQVEGELDAA